MRNTGVGQRGSSSALPSKQTHYSDYVNTRGSTGTANVSRERHARGSLPPRPRGYRLTPPVVELSIPVPGQETRTRSTTTKTGVRIGSAPPSSSRFRSDLNASFRSERNCRYDVRQRAGSAGSHRSSWRKRQQRHEKIDARDEDVRSVCTSVSSVVSRAHSDSAAITRAHSTTPHWPNANRITQEHRPVKQPPNTQKNGGAANRNGLPSAFAKVQDMVRQLRDSRLPVDANQLHNKSGLRELSIHGHQNSVDPVLAWSNLSRPTEREWTRHLSAKERGSEAPAASTTTTCSISVCSLSDEDTDEEEVGSLTDVGEDTMETISITPFVPPEEDEDVFRYGSNYERRTGQIINYYVEKEAPANQDNSDGRNDRLHQKMSRSVPSQASFYQPANGGTGYAQHWRSSTVPVPMQRRSNDASSKSISGRVFMGKRIHPPQKIVPAYRPKPMPRRGRSFVQIHQPITLMPRSQTADYSLHTHSVASNSCDEDSTDEDAQHANRTGIEQGMHNLRIVGTSLSTKRSVSAAKNRQPYTGGRDVTGFFSTLGRDSSKCFPVVNQDIQTQMQTISPPYSQQTSMLYLSNTSSHITVGAPTVLSQTGLSDDLCVYNYVNPSPRRRDTTAPNVLPSPADITVSDFDLTSQVNMSQYMVSQNNVAHGISSDGTPSKSMVGGTATSGVGLASTVIIEDGAEAEPWLQPHANEQSDSGVILDSTDPQDNDYDNDEYINEYADEEVIDYGDAGVNGLDSDAVIDYVNNVNDCVYDDDNGYVDNDNVNIGEEEYSESGEVLDTDDNEELQDDSYDGEP